MPKGKSFDNFTYGVGLEISASSFKQVRDDLKLNLDNLSKMIKSYSKVLKIDPNADLSKLFAEMRQIQSIVNGINSSNNPFSDFVDKGVLGRIAALEDGLKSVSSASNEIKANMSGLKDAITSALDPLKASGQAKFPATFDNLFGNIKDQSEQIKNVQNQIKTIGSIMKQIDAVYAQIEKTSGGAKLSDSDIFDLLSQFDDLKDELSNASKLNINEMSNAIKELESIGIKFHSAIQSLTLDQLKSFKIDDKYVLTEIDDLLFNLEEKQKQLTQQLAGFKAEQVKFDAKNQAAKSSGKSLGVQSDYTAQVKVAPKVNDAEWTTKINDTIKNIEPHLAKVHLTPTFSKSKNINKEIEGNIAQINHAVGLDLKVTDNLDKFKERIAAIDNEIKTQKAKLENTGSFKIKFDYEDGGKLRDVAQKVIKQFKQIDAKLYISNGKKFILDIARLREKAVGELKNIPVTLGNQEDMLASVDTLRSEIDKRIGNIDVKLNIQNIPQVMAQIGMAKDDIEKSYGSQSGMVGVDNKPSGATQGMVVLSDKAKEAQSNIEKIKITLKSLSDLGFKSPEFLKLGAFDEHLKPIKGSKEKLEQLIQDYTELESKLIGSKEDIIKNYGTGQDAFNAYKEDLHIFKQLESVATSILQRQIQYSQERLKSSEQVLAKEMQVVEAKREQTKTKSQDHSGLQLDQQHTRQLAMSAEEATKKVRSLNGTLTQQKKVLKDLDLNGIGSKSLIKLGEWDKSSNSFKKNSAEVQKLVDRYNQLKKARIDAGGAGKSVTGEEASLRGKLSALLREQKKHVSEIITQNQKELETAKQITAEYKQANKNKTQTVKTNTTKHLDELITKLNKAKKTLELLKSNKLDVLGSTGLGDVNKRLELVGSKQSFEELISFYNKLIAKRDELEKSGKFGSAEYMQYARVYQGIEQQMNVIHQDQLKYCESRISQLESEIAKEKEVLSLKQQQTKEDIKHQDGAGKNKKNIKTSAAANTTPNATTVKFDSATLSSLAKDATLKAIDGKINNILTQLSNGVVINGSNISIEASNVSVAGKGVSGKTGSGSNKNSGEKEVGISTLSSYSRQLTVFEEQVKRSGLYTDDFKKKLDGLHIQLNAVDVQDDLDTYKFDLDRFKEDFEQLKTYNQLYQDLVKSQTRQIQLNDKIATSSESTAALEAELKIEEQISREIESKLQQCSSIYNQRVKQLAIEEAIQKASQAITIDLAAQNDKNINKQNNDVLKIVNNAQKKLDQMQGYAQNSAVPVSDAAISKLKEYERLLTDLKTKQQEITNNPDLLKDADYSKDFNSLLQRMHEVEDKFNGLQRSSENFLSKIKSIEDIKPLDSTFDVNNLTQLHNEMQIFANQAGVGTAKLIEFNDVNRTATFEVQNGKGQVQQLTVAYDEATNSLGRYTSKTRESTSETQKFLNSLKHSFQNVARYIASFGSVYRLFAMIKQGVTYVKEIDSALTELKKVTDETDASYAKFLQDMSKTGSVIGATVKDLTTMAADWARLGYSMEEAGKLAESTAILLNVSEFDDATKASEALISTMQAFQYTADESQHVVDILNEVGEFIARR